jgi:protein SCO1
MLNLRSITRTSQVRRDCILQPVFNRLFGRAALVFLLLCFPALAAEETLPRELEGVGIQEKLGDRIDLDLHFTAENGYQVPLRSYFNSNKPVVLNLVYYSCPMLCNLVLNGQLNVLKETAWVPGNEFEIVTVSIDPMENWGLALNKKRYYMEAYGKDAYAGWHFLTDYQGNVKKLAEQVGFSYKWDNHTKQFAHAAALVVLTPDGRVSRYLYGIKHRARDFRLAVTEASEGKLGSLTDRILLFCFHYDANARSYVPFARNIMRAGGVLTILMLGGMLLYLFSKDRTRPVPDELVTAK